MQKIKLKETIEQIIKLLDKKNMKAKTLKNCSAGLRNIIRFFDKRGLNDIVLEQLDEFLLEVHKEHISGKFGSEKWRNIRRGCEMVKLFVTEGSIDIGVLGRWDYSRGIPMQYIESDPPTISQLSEKENVYVLAWNVRQQLIEQGLTANTVRHYSEEGLNLIIKGHYDSKTEIYSEKITDDLVIKKRTQYEEGKTRRQAYQNLRKAAFLIKEMHETGKITLEKLPVWNIREPAAEFSALLSDFRKICVTENRLTESSTLSILSAIRQFLFAIEDAGIKTVKKISPILVNTIAAKLSVNYPSGAGNFFYSIKLFLQFLVEIGITKTDLSAALPEAAVTKKAYHEPFTDDELKNLLEAPDRSTSIGNRDYAIMILALQTGLRACDIACLKRENIDWRKNTISIVQHKTGVPLSIPFPIEAGNAVADYLLHFRPTSDLPYIFLCHVGKKRPFANRSLGGIVSKYMLRIGIADPKRRRSFHSLRRTFGTSLLKCNISMELIQQMLGHTQMNSMKPYLSVEEKGLKQCALPLVSDIGKAVQL